MDMHTIREAVTNGLSWRKIDLVERALQPIQMAACSGIVEAHDNTTTVSLDSHDYLAVYDPDVAISLAWGVRHQVVDSLTGRGDLTEPWSTAGGFPDPDVRYTHAELRWNGQPVDHISLVIIDGGRGYLPAPTPVNPTSISGPYDAAQTVYYVSGWERDVARLVDELAGHQDFDSYLHRSGFLVGAPPQ